jgi:Sulfotransferase family
MPNADLTKRQGEFARNAAMERLLAEVNDILAIAEDRLVTEALRPDLPIIMVLGAPRAGSTLFMQWLAATGAFTCPTNLLSRFYRAPVIGAKIQKLLCDKQYAFRDELFDLTGSANYESHLGKTSGALSPNEFWYFWRRFFPIDVPQVMTDQQLSNVNFGLFLAELAGIQQVFGKPMAMKSMLLNFHAAWLADLSPKIFFVHLVRKPRFNMQSIVEARRRYFGNIEAWYSTKPAEFEFLKHQDPYTQVAGQLFFTTRAIDKQLSLLAPNRWIKVHYEDFCAGPESVFLAIAERMASQSDGRSFSYCGPDHFDARNDQHGNPGEAERLMAAYQEFSAVI